MDTSLKKRILAFIEEFDDGSEEVQTLKEEMKRELTVVDCKSHNIGIEDLNSLGKGQQADLRDKLGKKPGEEFNMEDCEKVADAIDELISEEFGENLINAIEYQLC